MNYRHIFHAGNICDVVKHAVLTLVLEKLCEKEKPFAVIDTHAGVGLYDLHDESAQKTREAEEGIMRFLASPSIPLLNRYEKRVREWGEKGFYPGSPSLIRDFLRTKDRLIACELHPEDAVSLKKLFGKDDRVHIHHRDGYEALAALTPPPERRGLVLIDPPYEKPDEYETLVSSLKKLHERWPQAVVMVWYPVKDRPTLWKFHENLIESGLPSVLCAEFIYAPETRTDRLNGSGLILINPPWNLDKTLEKLFPALHQALGTTHCESYIRFLRTEI